MSINDWLSFLAFAVLFSFLNAAERVASRFKDNTDFAWYCWIASSIASALFTGLTISGAWFYWVKS